MEAVERVARAICESLNIDPDGYESAHELHAAQEVWDGRTLIPLRNWQAAQRVARAAIAAMEQK